MAAAIPVVLKAVGVALSVKAAYDGIKEGNFFQAVIGAVGAYYGISSLASTATAAGSSTVSATAEGAAQGASTAGANTAEKLASSAAARGLEAGAQNAAVEGLKVGADTLTREAAKSAAMQAGGGATAGSISRAAAQAGGRDAFLEGLKTSGSQLAPRAGMEAAPTGMDAMTESFNDKAKGAARWVDEKVFEPGREAFGGQGKYAADGSLIPTTASEGGGLLSQGMEFLKDNQELALMGGQMVAGGLQGIGEQKRFDEQMKFLEEQRARRSNAPTISKASSIKWNPQTRRFSQVVA